ncbi:MAG: hypothetical protein JNL11_01070 [Bdellovibrionaceae bacterium]|nr:hypothetical protein [Pseudobdellovibrionaceae bacterium]
MDIVREPVTKESRTIEDRSVNQRIYQELGFMSGSHKRKGRRLIEFQILSALVDSLLILAISLFVCFLYLISLKTDLAQFLPHKIYFVELFGVIFLWIQFCYLVVLRTFSGATFGEKVFDVRLGIFQERYLLSYPFRVIYRTFIIYLFGIVTLPILSWFFKRDLAGEISGLKITSN